MTLAIVDPGSAPRPTRQELESLTAEWQRRLRLQDWDVKIQLRRKSDMSLDESQGAIRWCLPKKQASIEILDPIDYCPGSFGWEQDVERTLVHELLHLHFAPFATNEQPADTHQEQAVDLIAGALIAAKREAKWSSA